MNFIIERYRNLNRQDNWAIKPNKLSFHKKEDFINYLSHLTSVEQLGAFICIIDGIEYLLEVEPWAAGCLFANSLVSTNEFIGLTDLQIQDEINKKYLSVHEKRMCQKVDDSGYLPGATIPGLEDVILGISYALVKI